MKMGISDRLESTLHQDTYYTELYKCFNPLEIGSTHYTELHEPHSEISDEITKDDIDQSKDYEHRYDNNGKKTENIDIDEHKCTCPKRRVAIKAQKLMDQWMNAKI